MQTNARPKSRMTKQRGLILQVMRETKSHPTADEVYQVVRQRLPKISLGTVYRNLEVLCEQGLIKQVEVGGTQRRYDGIIERHWHARCTHCEQVFDIPEDAVSIIETGLLANFDFAITNYRLELQGICGKCRAHDSQVDQTARTGAATAINNDPLTK